MPHYYEREGSAEEQARVALQRAEAREARLDMDARRFSEAVNGLISVVGATTEQTNRLLARARASDAQVDWLWGVMAHCPFHFPACIANAECNTEDVLEGTNE